jgi:hypothetical protein
MVVKTIDASIWATFKNQKQLPGKDTHITHRGRQKPARHIITTPRPWLLECLGETVCLYTRNDNQSITMQMKQSNSCEVEFDHNTHTNKHSLPDSVRESLGLRSI